LQLTRLTWSGACARVARLFRLPGLRQSRLSTMLDLSADWYWETDKLHRFTKLVSSPRYGGDFARTAIGHTRWELPGVDPSHPGWRELRAIMDRRERFDDFTYSSSTASGLVRHYQISGLPDVDALGRFHGYRGLGREVTAQRQAEAALNASEAQLAAIIDAAADAVLTVDPQMRIAVFNESAGRMFGCGRVQALGQPLAHFVPLAQKLFAQLSSKPLPMPSPCTLARSLPVMGLRSGGQSFPAEATVSRIDAGGREMFCIVLRDLTERIAADRAREELETQLRQSQKMEAVGTLAGGIAHDFNNIIGAILGNAALLRTQVTEAGPNHFVSEIARACLRARELVHRILAFCRKQEPVFTCQPLRPLVEEGAQLLRAMVPSGVEIALDLQPAQMHVRADASQLQQVLMNLGANAWQAIGSRSGRITISLWDIGGEACLSVTDDGCGMDSAVVSRIFDPFFTTKPKGEGTGLGLAVVHGIVRSHGGRIAVQTRPGEGTRFEIWLPLMAEPALGAPDAAPALLPMSVARGRGQHVVFLDDYGAMVDVVTTTLRARGWRATGFDSVATAVEYLGRNLESVDLVVTDYNMPGASGLDLARRLLELKPDLPVVLTTGFVTDELRAEALAIGIRQVFDKSSGLDGMCDAIARILEHEEAD